MQQQQDGGGQVDARARDPNRFYCPYPGCNRSFAELWRLKVHYRAPPDVRGSGKERGHGTELKYCPKCNKELKAGKHHVGCSAGRPSVRASSKKKNAVRRFFSMLSLTPEKLLLHRRSTQKQSAASMGHTEAGGPHFVNGGHFPIHDQLYFDHDDLLMAGQHQPPLTIVVPPQHGHAVMPAPHYPPGGPYFSGTTPLPSTHHEAMHDPLADLHGEASTPWASSATAGPQGLPLGPHMGSGLAEPSGHAPSMHRAGSHALPSLQGTSTGVPPDNLPNWPGFGNQFVVPEVGEHIKVDDDHTSDLLGVHGSPSPPPLPPDWDASVKPSGLLFDFDSFNVSKQHHHNDSRPFITVTSAINPTDMIYPSDDYIMQVCGLLGCCG